MGTADEEESLLSSLTPYTHQIFNVFKDLQFESPQTFMKLPDFVFQLIADFSDISCSCVIQKKSFSSKFLIFNLELPFEQKIDLFKRVFLDQRVSKNTTKCLLHPGQRRSLHI